MKTKYNNKLLLYVGENLSRWQLCDSIGSHKFSNLKIKQYEKVIQKANIISFSTSKGS